MALEVELEQEGYHYRCQLLLKQQKVPVKKTVLKSKKFEKKRCFDLILTECVIDERTTMATG